MNRRTSGARIFVLGIAILGAVYAVGCGKGRPPTSGDDTAPGLTPLASGPCSLEGQSRPCHRLISQHEGVVTCSYGTQTCSGGAWSACGGPTESIATFPRGAKTMSLTLPNLPALKVVRLPAEATPRAASPAAAPPAAASPAAASPRALAPPQNRATTQVTQ